MPPEIAARFSGALAEALKLPDVQRQLVELSAEPVGNTPVEMLVEESTGPGELQTHFVWTSAGPIFTVNANGLNA